MYINTSCLINQYSNIIVMITEIVKALTLSLYTM